MSLLIVVIHVIVCLSLIMIVLLQTGKGADMGAAFGGGASQTLFGTTGASTFLSKATTAAAVIFMLTSLTLAYRSGNRAGDARLLSEPPARTQPAQDAQPAPTTEPAEQKDAGDAPVMQSQPDGQPGEGNAPADAPPASQEPAPSDTPEEKNP